MKTEKSATGVRAVVKVLSDIIQKKCHSLLSGVCPFLEGIVSVRWKRQATTHITRVTSRK